MIGRIQDTIQNVGLRCSHVLRPVNRRVCSSPIMRATTHECPEPIRVAREQFDYE